MFKSIRKFEFEYTAATYDMLRSVTTLPIERLCIYASSFEKDVVRFIRENETIENLEIRATLRPVLSKETLEALQVNRTLKVYIAGLFT